MGKGGGATRHVRDLRCSRRTCSGVLTGHAPVFNRTFRLLRSLHDMNRPEGAISPELSECIQQLRGLLDRRIRLIDAVIAVILRHPSATSLRDESPFVPEEVSGVLLAMLQSLGSSSATIVRLSDQPGLVTRDCYSIARSIVELAVNVCFLLTDGPTLADRAIRHANQKSYQDLCRESTVGNSRIRLDFPGRVDLAQFPHLQAQIAEFTSRAGREKGWVDSSIDERTAVVGARFGEDVLSQLHFARFMIYRHSSEIVHGTYFGCAYFLGLTSPKVATNIDEFVEQVGQQHMMVLMACGFAIASVLEVIHAAYRFPWLMDQTKALTRSMSGLTYLTKVSRSSGHAENCPDPGHT